MSTPVKACKAKLKICGMREPANITAVIDLQPDYMGFLMYPGSKRYIADLDPTVVRAVPAGIKTTGVFVDEEVDTVAKAIQLYGFKAVQLHGAESPEYCSELRELTQLNSTEAQDAQLNITEAELAEMNRDGTPDASLRKVEVIKAFGIDEVFDFNILSAYENVVDYFLFDTQTAEHGGSGKSFNWRLLDSYTLDKPYFLSGGIGLENVPQLHQIEDNRFYALDVNSRFELSPALKDIAKLTEFKRLLAC